MEKTERCKAMEKVKSRDWSVLPSDLLVSIAEHLRLKDIAHLPAVCGGWAWTLGKVQRGRSKLSSTLRATILPLKNSSPWLLLPNEDVVEAEYCDFLRPSEKDCGFSHIRFSPLPEMAGHICVGGSSDGWIATVDIWLNCRILNPLTREVFLLPSLSTIHPYKSMTPIYSDEGDGSMCMIIPNHPSLDEISFEKFRYKYVEKIVLSSPGPLCIVFLIHKKGFLVMAKVGDLAWTPSLDYSKYNFPRICDVIYNEKENKFFAIDSGGDVYVFDLKNYHWGSFLPPEVTVIDRLVCHELLFGQKYVVFSSSGDLLQVWRQCETISDNVDGDDDDDGDFSYWEETIDFKIFKFDHEHYDDKILPSSWVHVKEMGDDAIFLGLNHSICMTTSDRPWLRKNSVYFTEDKVDCRNYSNISNYSCDGGIFDLKDDKIERFLPKYSKINWPLPVWFMPYCLHFLYDS